MYIYVLHAYMQTYVKMHTYTCVHIHTHISDVDADDLGGSEYFTHTHIHTYIRMYVCIHTYGWVGGLIRTKCISVCITYVYVRIYIHTRIYMYIHIIDDNLGGSEYFTQGPHECPVHANQLFASHVVALVQHDAQLVVVPTQVLQDVLQLIGNVEFVGVK